MSDGAIAYPTYRAKGMSRLGKITTSVMVGGTVSRIVGGKFANGAVTAAFVHLFNDRMLNAKRIKLANNRKLVRKLRYEVERTDVSASSSMKDGFSLGASIKFHSKYYEQLPSCCVVTNIETNSYLAGSRIEYTAGFNSNGSPEITPGVSNTLIFEREFHYAPGSGCGGLSCSSGTPSGTVSQPSWFFDNVVQPLSNTRIP